MTEPGASAILPRPLLGRTFTTHRRVRLADADPSGRCRLDALARYAQDVARDDAADSGIADPMNWVVRRTMIDAGVEPVFEEWVELTTWCSGHGSRWAGRRTEIRGEADGRVEVVALWVRIDGRPSRPARLSEEFIEIYGAACGRRRVSARSMLLPCPPDGAEQRRWELRFSDLDVLGHVNNAAQWATIEEVLDMVDVPRRGMRVELEHAGSPERGGEVTLSWVVIDGGVDTWLTSDDAPVNAVRVRSLG